MGGFGRDPIPGRSEAPPRPQPKAPETPRLRVLNGPCAGREFALNKDRIRIGRSDPPAVTVDIDLGECEIGSPAMVSRLHAELLWVEGKLNLIDLGSRNGTWVDENFVKTGEQGAASEPIPLRPGSKIRFANLETEFIGTEVAEPA